MTQEYDDPGVNVGSHGLAQDEIRESPTIGVGTLSTMLGDTASSSSPARPMNPSSTSFNSTASGPSMQFFESSLV